MRRKDREVTGQKEILEILDKCEIIRLGLCADNKPYIVPVNFAWELVDGQVIIYIHGASEGRKMDMIAENSSVCIEADCSYELEQGDKACAWSAKFQSVIGEGTAAVVTEPEKKKKALDLLMARHGYEGMPSYPEKMLQMVGVLEIRLDSITGKQKQ